MHTYSICFQLFPVNHRLIADKTASFKVLQLRFACPVTRLIALRRSARVGGSFQQKGRAGCGRPFAKARRPGLTGPPLNALQLAAYLEKM